MKERSLLDGVLARLIPSVCLLISGIAIAVGYEHGPWWGVVGWMVFWIFAAIHDGTRDSFRDRGLL